MTCLSKVGTIHVRFLSLMERSKKEKAMVNVRWQDGRVVGLPQGVKVGPGGVGWLCNVSCCTGDQSSSQPGVDQETSGRSDQEATRALGGHQVSWAGYLVGWFST